MDDLDVTVHVELDDFRNALPPADATICFLETLDGPGWEGLLKLRAERPLQPMLLITRHSRHNARVLARAAFSDAEFLDSPIESIVAAIAALGRTTCLHTTARELRNDLGGRDSELAEALARACLRTTAVRTVSEIASIMGYHRSTLAKRWQQVAAAGSTPHLFLDWLRLIHALRARACSQRSWCAIAEELGVSDKTLAGSAKRIFGCSLREAEHLTTAEVVDRALRMFLRDPHL
jgi:AraC-like DNA-binding protein